MSGQLIRRFPKQIPILAKEIWRSSIHSMDGVAWIYFIFAIPVCHRLPTNLQKHKFLNPEMIRGNLCQCGQTEDEERLFVGPALAATQDNLRRPWIGYSGNGTCPTAILGYQQVSTSKKCGARPSRTHLLNNIDSIRH